MNDIERERSMPIFLLLSMALHALLFLIAPQLTAGLFPAFDRGEQGGVTLITLLDVIPPEQVRAAVPDAAREPRSRPQPAPNPEPRPQSNQAAQAPAPQPDARPVEAPQPASRPTPVAASQPEPVSATPAAAAVQVEEAPAARPATLPERVPSPVVAEQPQPVPVAEASPPAPEPVLTAESGVRVAPAPSPSRPTPMSSPPAAPSAVDPGASAQGASEASASAGPAGAGAPADEDVSSAAPGAEISDVPALPPTGQSMVADYGGALFPKDAVGLIHQPVTVRVAAIVAQDGTVLEGVVLEGTGIPYIDQYARTYVTRGLRYSPYSDIYEVTIFVTFDPASGVVTHRVADFINVPPTVGSFAS